MDCIFSCVSSHFVENMKCLARTYTIDDNTAFRQQTIIGTYFYSFSFIEFIKFLLVSAGDDDIIFHLRTFQQAFDNVIDHLTGADESNSITHMHFIPLDFIEHFNTPEYRWLIIYIKCSR